MNRLARLASQADMQALLSRGVQAFVGFQSGLAALQADIQRDISTLKRQARRTKAALPALRTLRELRWYSRCLGDTMAWQVMVFDRKAIAALNSGVKPPVSQSNHSDAAVFTMAAHLLGNQYGVPIVHDITNWLRVGDLTFLRWADDDSHEWFFRTVEVKSSLTDSTINEDGSAKAALLVDLYSNEPLELPEEKHQSHSPDKVRASDQNGTAERQRKEDRRIRDQFERLDKMVAHRDLKDHVVTRIDGMPNLIVRVDHNQVHHWADLRRAIRTARSKGYAFFDVDGFIGYALLYDKEGQTSRRSRNPRCARRLKNACSAPKATNATI